VVVRSASLAARASTVWPSAWAAWSWPPGQRLPTKKAHFVALYREHADYGVREAAGRVAGELAAGRGSRPVPPARTCTRSWPSWLARARRASEDRGRAGHPAVSPPVPGRPGRPGLAALFWRFNLSHWAMESNRARAMRWRTAAISGRAGSPPGRSWFTSGAAWRLQAGRPGRPGLTYRQRLLAARHYAIRLGRPSGEARARHDGGQLAAAGPPRKEVRRAGGLDTGLAGAVIATSTRADCS